MQAQLSPITFKTYDIRGIVRKAVDAETVRLISRAFDSVARAKDESVVIIGRNGRLSGSESLAALADGLRVSGADVISLGLVATPMVYLGTNIEPIGRCVTSGVIATDSHNPPDYNGSKMALVGRAIYDEQIQALHTRIEQGDFTEGSGDYVQVDIRQQYIDRIVSDIKLSHLMKIAVGCGNGVVDVFAPELFRVTGCGVAGLFCEVDDHFPNHHPDPAYVEDLQDLVCTLQTMDYGLGLAFDGDGDRLDVVTKDDQVIFPDRQLMLFTREVPSCNPGGEVIFGVKCMGKLAPFIREYGGKATIWKMGHSLVKAELRGASVPLAGKMSGHTFFKDHWHGSGDGPYTGMRLLGIVLRLAGPSTTLNALPDLHCTPELQLKHVEGESFELPDKIRVNATFAGAREVNRIDGVRVGYEDGFGLARPSNTTPVVVMCFEADSDVTIMHIQGEFRRVILAGEPDVQLPF